MDVRLFGLCLLCLPSVGMQWGCTLTGSLAKAPVTPLFTAGTRREREQQLILRKIKWQHKSQRGRILGDRYFRDDRRPITGVRRGDTLRILQGTYKGAYRIQRVLRSRVGKKRQVIVQIKSRFATQWKVIQRGSQGQITSKKEFTDAQKFLSEFPLGTRLVLFPNSEKQQIFTIARNLIVKTATMNRQRIGFRILEKIPPPQQSIPYHIAIPAPEQARKVEYRIEWKGSALTGRTFTIGINRRRYKEKEIEDLLNSQTDSKKALSAAPGKQATAIVFQIIGGLAVGVGGYLFLVNREDFRNIEYVPLSIAGGGLAIMLASIPLLVSQHNDYLHAAKQYNENLRQKLKLPKSTSPKTATRKERSTSPKAAAQKDLALPPRAARQKTIRNPFKTSRGA
ncbi:MAG: hypothetical protein AAGJ35_03355 [Myxococcota bacterium]